MRTRSAGICPAKRRKGPAEDASKAKPPNLSVRGPIVAAAGARFETLSNPQRPALKETGLTPDGQNARSGRQNETLREVRDPPQAPAPPVAARKPARRPRPLSLSPPRLIRTFPKTSLQSNNLCLFANYARKSAKENRRVRVFSAARADNNSKKEIPSCKPSFPSLLPRLLQVSLSAPKPPCRDSCRFRSQRPSRQRRGLRPHRHGPQLSARRQRPCR